MSADLLILLALFCIATNGPFIEAAHSSRFVVLATDNNSMAYFEKMCPGMLQGELERGSIVSEFNLGDLVWEMRRVNWCKNRFARLMRDIIEEAGRCKAMLEKAKAECHCQVNEDLE